MKRLIVGTVVFLSLMAAAFGVSAAVDVSDVTFKNGADTVYTSDAGGNITSNVTVYDPALLEDDTTPVMMLTAVYDRNKLTAVSYKILNVTNTKTVYSSDGVEVAAGKEVKAMIWTDGFVPLKPAAVLNNVSRDTVPVSVEVSVNEKTYDALVNSRDKIVRVHTNDAIANGNAQLTYTRADKSTGTAAFTIDREEGVTAPVNANVTFSSPQGQTEEYAVVLSDNMGIAWDEQFTGSKITDSEGKVDGKYAYPANPGGNVNLKNVPTPGTWSYGTDGAGWWNNGIWFSFKWGGSAMMGREGNGTSPYHLTLSVQKENEESDNDVLAFLPDGSIEGATEEHIWFKAYDGKGDNAKAISPAYSVSSFRMSFDMHPDVTVLRDTAFEMGVGAVRFWVQTDKDLIDSKPVLVFIKGGKYGNVINSSRRYFNLGEMVDYTVVQYKEAGAAEVTAEIYINGKLAWVIEDNYSQSIANTSIFDTNSVYCNAFAWKIPKGARFKMLFDDARFLYK